MEALWASFAISFGAVFVAELGDKSQLMALAFATRFRAWPVLLAITAATTVVHAGSVLLGVGLGSALPTTWISVIAAVAFFGFAAWTLRGDALTEAERNKADNAKRSTFMAAFWTVGIAFFLAELGDKTMLATITLATQYGWFGTWVGSTLGMVAADAIAIVVGRQLGRHLPEKTIRYGAAGLFVLFGVWLLVEAIIG